MKFRDAEIADTNSIEDIRCSIDSLIGVAGAVELGSSGNEDFISVSEEVDSTRLMVPTLGKIPILKLTKPSERFSKMATWSHKIIYDMRDPVSSCVIEYPKAAPTKPIFRYTKKFKGRNEPRPVLALEASAISLDITDLARIAIDRM